MKRKLLAGVAALAAMWAGAAAAQEKADVTLRIGDPAPALVGGAWVKGEPVSGIEPGKVYVLEFWATWCGPCIKAIPHVTELQQKHPEVVFIGQNVWERDESLVKPFLADMGDKMGYRVRMDDKSADPKGAMATTWMQAAGRNGIPASFIVDREGKIAWIGHPMAMDEPLAQVVAGTFDSKAYAETQRKQQEAGKRLQAAMQSGDTAKVAALFDEFAAGNPAMAKGILANKAEYLYDAKDFDRGIVAARAAVEANAADANALNRVVWGVVGTDGAPKEHVKEMLPWAQKAAELSKESDPAILDTLARAHYELGEMAKAVEVQEKAVAKAKGAMKDELKTTLEGYKASK